MLCWYQEDHNSFSGNKRSNGSSDEDDCSTALFTGGLILLKSCVYCGKAHPIGVECSEKPRYDRPRVSQADKFRRSYAWKTKQAAILQRDFHLCRICNDGKYGRYDGRLYSAVRVKLSVHHIEPLAECFERRLDDENLVTACPWHHKMADDGEIPRDYLHELAVTSPRWGPT